MSNDNFQPWPLVKDFLSDLSPGTVLVDVGCGNGKNLGLSPACVNLGFDRAESFAQIVHDRGHEALVCDALCLPYRTASAVRP